MKIQKLKYSENLLGIKFPPKKGLIFSYDNLKRMLLHCPHLFFFYYYNNSNNEDEISLKIIVILIKL